MKKLVQLALATAVFASATSAMSAPPIESFKVSSGETFEKYVTFTPTQTDGSFLMITGQNFLFSSLSFEFLSSGLKVIATPNAGVLFAGFLDSTNSNVTLEANKGYSLKITGQARSNLPSGYGLVSVASINGSVSPVPELESYAMFLAGLGLMAAIVRRRSNKV